MRLQENSQKWQILKYMKKHPNKIIDPVDFVNPFIWSKVPFIWYSASARLVELKKHWLVEVVGIIEPKMQFLFRSKPRQAYAITKKWLDFNLSK